ncbi:MAG: hypothetical protein RL071_4877 [Pseudomonadota bacterium]
MAFAMLAPISSQRKVGLVPKITALATPKPPAASPLSPASALPEAPSDKNGRR